MTSSTVSSESAPRSSTKEALGVTSASSTPNCSTMICFTRSSVEAIDLSCHATTSAAAGKPVSVIAARKLCKQRWRLSPGTAHSLGAPGPAESSPIHPTRSRLQRSTREFEEICRSSEPIETKRRIALVEAAIAEERAEALARIELLFVLGDDNG